MLLIGINRPPNSDRPTTFYLVRNLTSVRRPFVWQFIANIYFKRCTYYISLKKTVVSVEYIFCLAIVNIKRLYKYTDANVF